MEVIQSSLKIIPEIIETPWKLITLGAVALVIPALCIFIFNQIFKNTKLKQYKIDVLNALVSFVITFAIFVNLNRFIFEIEYLQSIILSIVFTSITTFIYLCIAIIFYIVWIIYSICKEKRIVKNVVHTAPKDEYENLANSSNVTHCANKFTLDYIKSFAKPGILIDRLEILKSNKDTYIDKLSDYLLENANIQDKKCSDNVAEFYYNYFLKRWSN